MYKNLADYQLQVKLFKEHLGQNFLAGFIRGPQDTGRKVKVSIFENPTANKFIVNEDESLYFVPQKCEKYGTEEIGCIKAITTLFIDLDNTSTPPVFDKMQPNLFIRRSDKNSFQAFFFLENPISPAEFKFYQNILTKRYNSDKLQNINHMMRVAGVRRGIKKKDAHWNIAPDLHYEVVSHHDKKLSKQDLDFLMRPAFKSSTFYQKNVFDAVSDADFKVIHTKEEAYFLDLFRNKEKGSGTSEALYRFACYLQDGKKRLTLSKFKKYCQEKNIDVHAISKCDEEEFQTVEANAKIYAKNKKKERALEEEKLHEVPEGKPDFQKDSAQYTECFIKLHEDHPRLRNIIDELSRHYFVQDEDSFYRENENKTLTKIGKAVFTATFKTYTRYKKNGENKELPCNPVDLFLAYENRPFFNVASSIVYQPHSDRLVINNDYKLLNTWSYPILDAKKGDTSVFVNHIKWMFEGQEAVDGSDLGEFFLDYLAYVYCNPKPASFCWLLVAPKVGIGRTFFTDILRRLMGEHNVSAVTPDVARDQYTSWYSTKQFAVVEELKKDGGFYQKLKPVIANEHISHREMHKNPTTVRNYCNLFILSNHLDCLKIDDGDRRILAVHMHNEPRSKEYYDQLYTWKENPENISAIADYLRDRNTRVNKMSMLGHAPITDAKQLMQNITRPDCVQDIESTLPKLSFGDNKEFVCKSDVIQEIYPNELNNIVKYGEDINKGLINLKYVPVYNGTQKKINGVNVRFTFYVKASLASQYTKKSKFEEIFAQWKIKRGLKLDDTESKLEAERKALADEKKNRVLSVVREEPQPASEPLFTQESVKKQTGTPAPAPKPKAPANPGPVHELVKRAEAMANNPDYKPRSVRDLARIRDEFCERDNDVSVLLKNNSA